ncbi:hypothetical protein GC170_21070 [bacterium]|nr:hypothetical protein [bacterium]
MRNRNWTWPAVLAAAGLAASSAGIDAQTDRENGSENSAVPNASPARELQDSGPPEPPRAPQSPAGAAEEPAKVLSTTEAVMLRSRSARTLLRNGTDYIKYQQFEKALAYLREAERRQKELNATEKTALRQAIDTAQQGLRTPSLQTGYARTRRPQAGSIAIASRTAAASKSDPAVARTQAPAEVAEAPAQAQADDRMVPGQLRQADPDKLAPLSPEILAKELPSAADLAQSDSARSALKEYQAAGSGSTQPRKPIELPRPLNEKIEALEESASQYQASESRPDPSPASIAASLAAMRRDGTPEPLPGSPAQANLTEEPRPVALSDAPAPLPVEDTPKEDQSEPAPAVPARTEVSLAEPAPAPVVETPELPPLEPASTEPPADREPRRESASDPMPSLSAPEAAVERSPEPVVPSGAPDRSAPAEMPPLPVEPAESPSASETPEPAAEFVPQTPEPSPAMPDLPAEPVVTKVEKPVEPAAAEAPGATQPGIDPLTVPADSTPAEMPLANMPAERDPNLSKVQDLVSPASKTPEALTAPIKHDVAEETARPDAAVETTATPAEPRDLPPLSSGAGARSLNDSLPPLPVQPIAEAADESSDLPPLPDRPTISSPADNGGLPPLPTGGTATQPATPQPVDLAQPVTEEPTKAELPPLPTAAAEPAAMPPLPTASTVESPASTEAMPPLPGAAEAPKAAEPATNSDSLPKLPDTPPAPTAVAEDSLPKLPEAPIRTAQANPADARAISGSSDSLPPLPAEEIAGGTAAVPATTETARAERPAFSRRLLSGLSDNKRREIEELARIQLERSGGATPGLSPLDSPAREAGDSPRVPLPAGNTSMFGATDDPLVRLELPRAPSPAEARPIRAILLPEQFDTLKQREFEPRRKMWASAATAHYPLYFQDPSLERYGISVEQRMGRAGRKLTYPIDDPKESKLRNQIATPFFSSGLFALQIATWPFRAIADPPWESTYDLGYYRPGDLVPEDTVVIPWKGVGPLFRGNGY